ncbi:unnamed protein product [Mycena citricolor]|uniref:Uncharacterized protein n=1 Tax=Mycena citricolor TaxID=2018698 RepID=A0AAD2I0H9_9AGAR|nr:unnamed protein product [Mycena citricolor]CAK5284855.1 unnamed protein product [Mycena citricolor]
MTWAAQARRQAFFLSSSSTRTREYLSSKRKLEACRSSTYVPWSPMVQRVRRRHSLNSR